MTPLFVPFSVQAPAGALAVDGAVAGATATYSHWQGDHTTPAALAADTSTGMLVRAATDPTRWLAPYRVACNNHVDADGLLAMIAVCRPELAVRHAALMIAAATAGDFTTWTGEPAYRLVLRLHQCIRDAQVHGDGWEQRCLDTVISDAESLLTNDDAPGRAERDAAVTQARTAIAWLTVHPPTLTGRLAVVRWPRRLGHASDQFMTVHQPDDLPLIALSTAIPPTCFQLLIEDTPAGAVMVLDAPRHSWARTVDLPAVAWPDLAPMAADLRMREPDVAWTARPGAEAIGFTCLLASRGPSRLDPALVAAACTNLLDH